MSGPAFYNYLASNSMACDGDQLVGANCYPRLTRLNNNNCKYSRINVCYSRRHKRLMLDVRVPPEH